MTNVTALRTRRPTGKPGWPRLLLTGAEGSWKSGTAAFLSADERIGGMFWLEVGDGETTADEYGAFPGVEYTILDHDGTWLDIYNQVSAAWDEAKKAEEAGELPVAIAVDAMSGIWSMLMDMGDSRARKKAASGAAGKGGGSVAWSADYEATITPDLWGLIKKRHGQLMTKLLTWPGPVVLVSRERIATVFENGQPTSKKDWTLECKKDLPSQVTAWVRLEGQGVAHVVKLRSVKAGMSVMPDQDRSKRVSDFTVAKLIFDWVGCEVGVSKAARMTTLNADQDMPDEVTEVPGPQQPGPQQPGPRAVRSAEQNAAYAKAGMTRLLAAATAAEATELHQKAKSDPVGEVRVYEEIGEDRRDILGITPEQSGLTLAGLGHLVVAYVERRGMSVDAALDAVNGGAAQSTAVAS